MVARSQQAEDAEYAPNLTEEQEAQGRRVETTPLPVIHEVIRKRGEDELARSNSALAWSGLAAGLSMGFSMIAEGLFRAHLPHAEWAPLVSKIGYSTGFMVVILGRQQLFTENTLTPVIPVLARRNLSTALQTLRLWTVVFITNVIGALCVASVLGHSDVFHEPVKQAFSEIGKAAIGNTFGTTLLRGIFAGWLIAMVVWLMPAVPSNRFWIILLLTWLVGIGELSHCIAGSVESVYVVTTGQATWGQYFLHFLIPATLGNTIGGVSLVAVLNHAQLVAGERGGQQQEPRKQGNSRDERASRNR